MESPIPNYKPKANHPWRRYRNKIDPKTGEQIVTSQYSIKTFLFTLTEHWDTYTIPSSDPSAFGEASKIKFMRDDKIVEWLVDILRRNWLNGQKPVLYP